MRERFLDSLIVYHTLSQGAIFVSGRNGVTFYVEKCTKRSQSETSRGLTE